VKNWSYLDPEPDPDPVLIKNSGSDQKGPDPNKFFCAVPVLIILSNKLLLLLLQAGTAAEDRREAPPLLPAVQEEVAAHPLPGQPHPRKVPYYSSGPLQSL